MSSTIKETKSSILLGNTMMELTDIDQERYIDNEFDENADENQDLDNKRRGYNHLFYQEQENFNELVLHYYKSKNLIYF